MFDTKYQILTRLLIVAGVIAFFGVTLYPGICRFAAHHSIRQLIEAGNEDAAVAKLQWLSRKSWFHPNWTIAKAMPQWEWVHELDAKLFGCPSCRGLRNTLLGYAAHYGQFRSVTNLLHAGADINHFQDNGAAILQSAISGGNTNIIALVLARGVDVNATNFAGRVFNFAAGFCRKPEVIEFLLAAGAQPNLEDNRGWTALDWASVWNKNMIPLLQAHGAVAGTNRIVPLPR